MTTVRRAWPAVAALCLLTGVGGWAVRAARQHSHRAVTGAAAISLEPGPGVVAVSTDRATRGRVLSAAAGAPPRVGALTCTRFYAAGGTGLCLRPDGDLPTYQLAVLDAHLRELRTIPLVGVPNRARVSPSGRWVAWTVFVAGDSYNGGRFSTRVGLLDTRTRRLVPTLEDWKVSVGARPYRAADVNFWGVTFAADDRRFYATMSTAGHRYLVRGDLATGSVEALRDNVECPSLSPDGTRVAFKSAVAGDPRRGWRLAVLDLATMRETPLAETRSVDDQAAWLDDRTVAYALPRGREESDVWQVPADGSGRPALLLAGAASPASLRASDPALS
ncbi:PD40 domain-containing protein [Nonomuraea sediminis]|uniref:PD40 domain-containing protein n=1 Tax=Nonomuraea sediminis TaxID=2835864 RepID=UPI001BDC8CC1|nr:PD40 domain-containing protein [Nonomuraea sediminis]